MGCYNRNRADIRGKMIEVFITKNAINESIPQFL